MQISKQILEQCKAKQQVAQKQVYKALLPYLQPIAKRYLRNNQFILDVLQESFVKIFQQINQFDPIKGNLDSWASKIVINTAINYNNRIIGINTKPISEGIDSLCNQAKDDNEQLSKEQLLKILRSMPKGYFEIFNLYVIDGYDHEEISQILDINVGLSRKRLSRAREWLRKSDFLEKIIAFLIFIQIVSFV